VYGVYTAFLAGKSPYIRSYRCVYTVLAYPPHKQSPATAAALWQPKGKGPATAGLLISHKPQTPPPATAAALYIWAAKKHRACHCRLAHFPQTTNTPTCNSSCIVYMGSQKTKGLPLPACSFPTNHKHPYLQQQLHCIYGQPKSKGPATAGLLISHKPQTPPPATAAALYIWAAKKQRACHCRLAHFPQTTNTPTCNSSCIVFMGSQKARACHCRLAHFPQTKNKPTCNSSCIVYMGSQKARAYHCRLAHFPQTTNTPTHLQQLLHCIYGQPNSKGPTTAGLLISHKPQTHPPTCNSCCIVYMGSQKTKGLPLPACSFPTNHKHTHLQQLLHDGQPKSQGLATPCLSSTNDVCPVSCCGGQHCCLDGGGHAEALHATEKRSGMMK